MVILLVNDGIRPRARGHPWGSALVRHWEGIRGEKGVSGRWGRYRVFGSLIWGLWGSAVRLLVLWHYLRCVGGMLIQIFLLLFFYLHPKHPLPLTFLLSPFLLLSPDLTAKWHHLLRIWHTQSLSPLGPALSVSSMRIHVETFLSPPSASEFLDFLMETIFVFTGFQLLFPSGHALGSLQEHMPLWHLRLVFHTVYNLLSFWCSPSYAPLAYFLASLRFRPRPPLTFMLVCLPHHALVFFSIQPSPTHVSGSGPFCLSHPGYPQRCDTPAIHSVCLNPQAAEYMKIQLVVTILVSSIPVVSGPAAAHLSWVFGAMYNILMDFSSVPLPIFPSGSSEWPRLSWSLLPCFQ